MPRLSHDYGPKRTVTVRASADPHSAQNMDLQTAVVAAAVVVLSIAAAALPIVAQPNVDMVDDAE